MKPNAILVLAALAAGSLAAAAQDRIAIRGRVMAAPGSEPVAGARVWVLGRIRRDQPRAGLNEARTGADGAFEIADVPRNQARMLSVAAPGFARGWAQVNVEGTPAGGAVELEIRLEPGRTLRGRVVDRQAGRPVAGATVTADQLRAETDAEGRFALEGLERGADVPVTVSAKGYQPAEIVLAAADPAEVEVPIEIEPGLRLAVRVVDEDHRPLAGLRVRARLPKAVAYSGLERADFSAVTGEDGVAILAGFPAGQPVAPEVEAEGFVPTQGDVMLPTPTGAVAASPAADLVLTTGRTAGVEVRSMYGLPLAGARVELLPLVESLLDFGGFVERGESAGAIRDGRTGADGRIVFERLPAGVVTCEVRAAGHLPRLLVLRPAREPAPAAVVALERDPRPPASDLPWEPSVAAAFRRADETGLPILVSMAMDGERANDHLARAHFHDPEIVRIARELPVILTNVFGKDGVPGPAGSSHTEADGVCTRYGAIPCSAHQAAEPWAIDELFGGRRGFQVPRHVVLTRDGRTLQDRTFYLSERDLRWMMVRALRHERPEVAGRLARERLGHLLRALGDDEPRRREAAAADLVALVNGGDEFAVALLGELRGAGVRAPVRRRIIEGMLVDALHLPASALRPFFSDEDGDIRLLAVRGVAPLAATDIDVQDALIPFLMDADSVIARVAGAALDASVRSVNRPAEGDRWRIVAGILRAESRRRLSTTPESQSEIHRQGTEVEDVIRSGSVEGRNAVLRILARSADGEEMLLEVARDPGHRSVPALGALARLVRRLPSDEVRMLVDRYLEAAEVQMSGACGLARAESVRLLGDLPGEAARGRLVSALSDPAIDVRGAAALALWRRGDRRGASTLLEALGDPLLRVEVEALLKAEFTERMPTTPAGWRAWMEAQGFPLPDEERR